MTKNLNDLLDLYSVKNEHLFLPLRREFTTPTDFFLHLTGLLISN